MAWYGMAGNSDGFDEVMILVGLQDFIHIWTK
jgi:hypothetical protein